MPKRYLLALAIISLTLAACNSGYSQAELFGVTPTPTPTATAFVANTGITSAVVQALQSAYPSPAPVENIVIYEATPNAQGNLGSSPSPIASAVTNASGEATFSGLVYNAPYCWWWTSKTATTPTTYAGCFTSQEWQGGVIPLGTGF